MAKATQVQITNLRNKLLSYDNAYHNTGKPLVPDEEYDRLVDILYKHSPNDVYFDRVGAEVTGKKKTKLPYPMPSLKKVRVDRGLEKFLTESTGTIVVSDKLDGSSLMHIDVNGKEKLFTRGNGTVGQDVSYLIPHLKGLGRLKRNQAVRGEAIIKEGTFAEHWNDKYENSRGLVNGAINSGKAHESIGDVQFVAHGSVSPKMPWAKARVMLKSQGYETAATKVFKNPTPQALTDYFEDRKKASPFTLDGLVLEDALDNKPISFKVDAAPERATVKLVKWDVSRHGIYKPVVHFTTPIRIGGVSVSKATGHNANYIVTHKIGPGAVVKVIRSGDVIPKVVGTIKGTKPQLPADFEWDSKKIEALAVNLSADQEDRVVAKNLTASLTILRIEGIRMAAAEKLVQANITNLPDLYDCDVADFEDAGIGKANAEKLHQGLHVAKREATHAQLMYASHCWPRGFAEDKFDLILQRAPFHLMVKATSEKLLRVIESIRGLSTASAKVFINNLDDYEDFLDQLGWAPKSTKVIPPTGNKFAGMNIAFTGIRDKDLERVIVSEGGKLPSTVSSNTSILITNSINSNSSKRDRADSLGIKVMEIKEFKSKYRV